MTVEEEIQSTHDDDRAGKELSNNAALFRGVDRLAQVRNTISDMRMIFDNDIRFIRQF